MIKDHILYSIEELEKLYNNPLQNPKREDTYHFCPKDSYHIKYVVLDYNKEKDKLYVAKNGTTYTFELEDFKLILKSIYFSVFTFERNIEDGLTEIGNNELNHNTFQIVWYQKSENPND